jgi:hypothetical protein
VELKVNICKIANRRRRNMKRSLYAIIMFFVIGLFLIPVTIYAQSDQDATIVSPIEQSHACKSDSRIKHSFIVKLKDEVSSILSKMKSIITGKGGSFEGNKEYGSFEGKSVFGTIKVEYRSISYNEIEITIDDKPLVMPYITIESEIRKYLS